ncbi:DUF6228 family protein [Streptomyces sp. NPDC005209]|uniref:DUF6228 family protein n=1 Tax=Streptomyces sp. NPDC005209 TaxID=3156715 RepID=UPI0033BE41FF
MIDYDGSGSPAVRVGSPGQASLLLSGPTRPFEDEPTLDFRGWEGAHIWHSLYYDPTVAAEHRPNGYVHLTWGIHERAPSEEWHFETTTVHPAGEEMRSLAVEVRTFIASLAE